MFKLVKQPRSGAEFALMLLTYVAIGPLLGAFAMMIPLAIVGIYGGGHPYDIGEHLWNLALGSYLFGVLPAFIAGFVVSMQKQPSWQTVSVVGVAIGLPIAVWILWSQSQSLSRLDLYSAVWRGFSCLTLPILTCVVPTVGCWLIARLILCLSRLLSGALAHPH
jgi:hypothetical protein